MRRNPPSHTPVKFLNITSYGRDKTKMTRVDVTNIKSIRTPFLFFFFFFWSNQKVKSIIVTEVTVMSPFIMYSSQNPWNFLDMEVIMIKEDDKCLSPFTKHDEGTHDCNLGYYDTFDHLIIPKKKKKKRNGLRFFMRT